MLSALPLQIATAQNVPVVTANARVDKLLGEMTLAEKQVRLNWYTPEQRRADHEAAIAAAKRAKTAVVFVWTRRVPFFGLAGTAEPIG